MLVTMMKVMMRMHLQSTLGMYFMLYSYLSICLFCSVVINCYAVPLRQKEYLTGRRTCYVQVVDLSSGWAPLHSVLEQATFTCVPLSPSSIIWYLPRVDDLFG